MSLVGNLEDLSLGDILQIISLSQKSGVLALASDQGSGRIVFRKGMVESACLKGGASDLRQLLVGGGVIDPTQYDASLARSQDLGVAVEEALAGEAGLSTEKINGLVKESVEAAIFEMFTWPSGDFSFDVRTKLDPEDPQLVMPHGINAQYLAMEGLRLCDERARDQHGRDAVDPNAETHPGFDDPSDDPIFGSDALEIESDENGDGNFPLDDDDADEQGALGSASGLLDDDLLDFDSPELQFASSKESPDQPTSGAKSDVSRPNHETPTAADALVASVIERADAADDREEAMPGLGASPPAASGGSSATAPNPKASQAVARDGSTSASGKPVRRATDPEFSLPSAKKIPVVLIDPDVMILEWVKSAIEADFARVHVFQKADQGLARIRQYLIRGEVPLVLVSSDTQIDPLSGIHGLGDFVKRLKAQAPRLIVLGLREGVDAAPTAMPANLDGVLRRPGRQLLAERSGASGEVARQILARALLEILAHADPKQAEQRIHSAKGEAVADDAGGKVLRETTARLQEASSRGEILPVVLDFAAEIFARVAILIVRDGDVFAIAGRRIPSLEVDPLSAAPTVTLEACGPGLVRSVVESNQATVAAAITPADLELLEYFGGVQPESIYLAPIESGASVIALLYADQGASELAMPVTDELEEVLHHAGLALDRAALERALWEADADSR